MKEKPRDQGLSQATDSAAAKMVHEETWDGEEESRLGIASAMAMRYSLEYLACHGRIFEKAYVKGCFSWVDQRSAKDQLQYDSDFEAAYNTFRSEAHKSEVQTTNYKFSKSLFNAVKRFVYFDSSLSVADDAVNAVNAENIFDIRAVIFAEKVDFKS